MVVGPGQRMGRRQYDAPKWTISNMRRGATSSSIQPFAEWHHWHSHAAHTQQHTSAIVVAAATSAAKQPRQRAPSSVCWLAMVAQGATVCSRKANLRPHAHASAQGQACVTRRERRSNWDTSWQAGGPGTHLNALSLRRPSSPLFAKWPAAMLVSSSTRLLLVFSSRTCTAAAK